jgi:hypothetical protein
MEGMEEVAPPFERWEEHLKDLSDRDIKELANDYRWIDEEARPQQERQQFHARREAIIAECERRGLHGAVEACRRPAA